MNAAERISDFTNDRARHRFETAYRQALTRLFPQPVRRVAVPTAYGEGVAYRLGKTGGTPVVLVPGSGGNALSWHRYVARLARDHPVIALDPVGEPGPARQTRPITTAHDVAAA